MSNPDNFITGAAVGAFIIMLFTIIPFETDHYTKEKYDCISRAKAIDCVRVWVPVGEAKQ